MRMLYLISVDWVAVMICWAVDNFEEGLNSHTTGLIPSFAPKVDSIRTLLLEMYSQTELS